MIGASSLENTCLSGGADGADLMWGMCAGSLGHTVIHWSFNGARSSAPSSELLILSDDLLQRADERLVIANEKVRRRFPTRSWKTNNLLRRNWYQVETAGSCYAVSTIMDGKVQGGTAWAVQMFIDRFGGQSCECYVFCQREGRWFKWSNRGWSAIYSPPSPEGIYAGIGTRALSFTGKLAIRTLMNWSKPARRA